MPITIERRFDVKLVSTEVFKQYMAFRNHTVRSLAARAGCSHATIGHLRTGARSTVRPALARAIARALDCPVETLFVPRVSIVSRESGHSATRAA